MKSKPVQKSSNHRTFGSVAVGAALCAAFLSPIAAETAYAAPLQQSVQSANAETITGTVVETNGDPVIGASVKVKNTTNGIVTDFNGKFNLKVAPGSTIEVSFIGFSPASFVVEPGKTSYNVVLQPADTQLDEVVVVGYGTQKKVNLTGSVSSISVDKISESRPVTNISQALAGLAAGVSVVSGSNQPGNDNATIRVRGVGTLNSAAPLIIIDGVEAGINTVQPQDIESMSVLKDAASASIYGSRAANGVILITTKKGTAGTIKLNYNGFVSFESIRKTLTPVSDYAEYMELINEGYENSYNQKNYVFSDAVIQEWRDNPNDPYGHPNQDWIDATFRPATSTNHVLSMNGGTKDIRFYSSFGYTNNPGVMTNSGFERYSTRISVDADIRPWLTLGAFANGYRSTTEIGSEAASDIFTYASATTPAMYFLHPDGRFGGQTNNEDDPQTSTNNPILRANNTDGMITKNNMRTRFVGTIRPFKGFSVTGTYNYEFLDTYKRTKPVFNKVWNFRDDIVVLDNTRKTSVSNNNGRTERHFWDAVARYETNVLKKLNVNLLAGASNEFYSNGSFTASRQDIVDLSLWALSACTGDSNSSGSTTEWSMRSFFGRLNLNWDDKYLLEANIRYDGSSRFQKGRRWGAFPSASAAWRLDREHFMESLVEKGLNGLKVRASYGKLGNNSIGNYASQSLYTSSGMNYVLGNSLATGLGIAALSNSLVTWESTTVADLGFDVSMLNNRFSLTADFFNKRTNNILISLPAPAVHGTASLPTVNSAVVSNRGFELTAGWNDRIGDLNYGISGNFTYVTNNVDKFKGKSEEGRSISGTNLIWEGHSINSQYMLRVDRIIQTDEDLQLVNDMIANAPIDEATGKQKNPFAAFGTPAKGDFLYKDMNGDGVIDQNDRTIVSDGPNAKYLIGLNLNAEYKGIDFSMLLQSNLGASTMWKSDAYNTPTVRKGYQINKAIAEGRWYEGRTDATSPRLLFYQNTINTQNSDFYLQDLSFLKIRNIQLGYTIPASWAKACSLSKVRVYGSLENFFTFTKFKGFDPEVSGLAYPTMRQAVLGLNVTF